MFFMKCVLVLLFALYFLWMGSIPAFLYTKFFFFYVVGKAQGHTLYWNKGLHKVEHKFNFGKAHG